MTRTEAAQVLAVMASPHNRDVSVDTAEVWYRAALEPLDYATALDVAMEVVEHEERFPTPAVFNAARTRLARRAALQQVPKALEAPRVKTTPTQIAELRQMLADKGTRNHDHRGPRPCPVCGGINPNRPPEPAA